MKAFPISTMIRRLNLAHLIWQMSRSDGEHCYIELKHHVHHKGNFKKKKKNFFYTKEKKWKSWLTRALLWVGLAHLITIAPNGSGNIKRCLVGNQIILLLLLCVSLQLQLLISDQQVCSKHHFPKLFNSFRFLGFLIFLLNFEFLPFKLSRIPLLLIS